MTPAGHLSGDPEGLRFCPPLCVTKCNIFQLADRRTEAESLAQATHKVEVGCRPEW